ncbi:hypothetical protein HQN89_07340 [Paenibacillus frigoriresistens]|uniref:hypothetical protein n=1 Tax=Paenibacillus alginolyticus TaxID=59839 RepID=UPI0015652A5B|nr:hypothetical protein [Paenibacillus frigoriresistens]NRF90841.1 hypothetical protein [Paenibacillus frigoriresistens]
MFRKWFLSFKWRKLRLRVWEKRLQQQLQLISRWLSLTIHCSLHVSWGPFYGGSVIIDRKYKKTKIFIQIPFDYSAQKTMNYQNLHVEQCADDFAYRQYLDLCEKAG